MTTRDDSGPMRPRLWYAPVTTVLVLMSLLATLYLGYVLEPETHLHHFPVALVNRDVGETMGGRHLNAGALLADGLASGIPADKVSLRVEGISDAERQLQRGQIYGAFVIPSDFTKRLSILGVASVVSGMIERPIVTVFTNSRSGPFAAQIMQTLANQAMSRANSEVGTELTALVNQQLAPPPSAHGPPTTAPTQISGAARLTLATPINVVTTDYRPLPDGTGAGLSAFFYTLLLLLGGYVGAMIIHVMTDSALGFTPTEYGPWSVARAPTQQAAPISRLRTLGWKWAISIVVAPLMAGAYLGIAMAMGMPVDHSTALFLYSAFAITAVAVTSLAVLAALGSAGMLVNLIIFVVLGLPSCGGTIPVEATPKYVGWLAGFEPMHQIYLGVRAILYFDSHGDAGMLRAGWMTLLGLGVGIVIGLAVTTFYDHKGLHRSTWSSRPSQ